MDTSLDHGYVTKHTKVNRYVQKWDDIHASDEFMWLDEYEPLSPTSSAIIDALMMAYPDKF